MNNLPKTNKWIILFAVVLASLIISFIIVSLNPATNTQKPATTQLTDNANVVATPSETQETKPVEIKLNYNLEEGYIDILISTEYSLDHGELLFNLSNNLKYSKIEEGSLFEKYFSAVETDKDTGDTSFRLGVTKGIEGLPLSPGKNLQLARIYFTNLTQDAVSLDESQSTFFVGGGTQEGDPEYKVVVVK